MQYTVQENQPYIEASQYSVNNPTVWKLAN